MTGPLIGVIADDFTGGTDLGSTLRREGLEVVQTVGVPPVDLALPAADAIVVGVKTRTAPVADAVQQSAAALAWLRGRGGKHAYFKYCSTFDSRDDGNIGPVADRLLDALDASFTVVCPAFPETGRTVYQGHLFVGDTLLGESPMAHHPLTPMTDSSVLRLLGRQTSRRVGLVAYPTVARGAAAIRSAFDDLAADGVVYAVVDAVTDGNLRDIACAAAHMRLVTGASGLARGLPAAYGHPGAPPAPIAWPDGRAAVIAGSVSRATREQVERFSRDARTFEIDPMTWRDERAGEIADAAAVASAAPVLVHSANDDAAVRTAQQQLGVEGSAVAVERAFALIAVALVERGIRRLIVAGGETSAAVVGALGITAFRIGPDIAPGVPWCLTLGDPPLAIALKSGNFGGPDFFADALRAIP